jgi:hypothetical protein
MTQNIIELLGILTITLGIALNIISAPQEQPDSNFVEPTSIVTEVNFCSQGGMLPPSVKPCGS